jgi:hypothetical protein
MRKLLVLFLLVGMPSLVQAQPTCDPATLFKNLKPTTFIAALQACAADDVAAVIADANTEPKDFQTLACMMPLQRIVLAKQQGGLLLAFQQLRNAKRSGFISACQAWVNSVLLP